MAKIRECFVCGMLLALSERQKVDVQPPDGPMRTAEVCARCWLKVHGAGRYEVTKREKLYVCRAAQAVMELFPPVSHSAGSRGTRRG